jgi:acyl-coenzyme A synthetase/AMP-(fatty) acid ligase
MLNYSTGPVLHDYLINYSNHFFINKCAIKIGNLEQTFKEFNLKTNKISNSFYKLNLKKGDIITFLSMNSIKFYEILFGCSKSGIIFSNLSTLLKDKKIFSLLKCKIIFCHEEELNFILECIKELKFINKIVIIDNEPKIKQNNLIIHYNEFLKYGNEDYIDRNINEDDIIFIDNSSGTTGYPKLIEITQRQLIDNSLNFTEINSTYDWCFYSSNYILKFKKNSYN